MQSVFQDPIERQIAFAFGTVFTGIGLGLITLAATNSILASIGAGVLTVGASILFSAIRAQ